MTLADETKAWFEAERRSIRAATIEECAKVADRYAEDEAWEAGDCAREIAVDIRALNTPASP